MSKHLKSYTGKNFRADYRKRSMEGCEQDIFQDPLSDTDSDYRTLLVNEYIRKSNHDSLQVVSDATEVNDPQYEMFLSSLKPKGKLWLVVADKRNGLPNSYCMEDNSEDELDKNTQKERHNMKGLYIEHIICDSSSNCMLEDQGLMGRLPNKKKGKAVVEYGLKCDSSKHIKKRRNTVVENGLKSDSSKPIKSNPSVVEQCLDGEDGIAGGYGSDTEFNIDIQSGFTRERNSKIVKTLKKVTKKGRPKIVKTLNKVTKRRRPKSAVNVEHNADLHDDEEYQFYLKHCRPVGKRFVFTCKHARRRELESDIRLLNDEIDDSTHYMKGKPMSPEHMEGSSARVDGGDIFDSLSSPRRERDPTFREQLISILRNPFDSKEHDMLKHDITVKKQMERNLDLRFGREQSYVIDKDGKSYLDHYPDLRKKIEASKGHQEELNLLRGFFFWLQNLTQEGAFRPWKDAQYLALNPRKH